MFKLLQSGVEQSLLCSLLKPIYIKKGPKTLLVGATPKNKMATTMSREHKKQTQLWLL